MMLKDNVEFMGNDFLLDDEVAQRLIISTQQLCRF